MWPMLQWIDDLDSWIQIAIMRPAFTWVQGQFHWSRLQLILAFIYIERIGGILVFGVLFVRAVHDGKIVLGILNGLAVIMHAHLFTSQLARIIPCIREAIEKEAHTRHFLNPELLSIAIGEGNARPYVNLIAISSLLIDCLCFIAALRFGFSAFTPFVLVSNLVVPIYACYLHLWDVDNVPPEDRKYLFEPKKAHQDT